ncbi:MAG: hypothetical protein NZM43_05990 [Saprospiraceae bacterium]|nr:hypothetical protein [Saprospiraceae bacterium]MDW8483860.1 hypothetical protein [Saprospiraceae bacterium]
MARLTTFSRLLITLLIVGGVYFGIRTFLPQLKQMVGSDSPAAITTTYEGDAGAKEMVSPPPKSEPWGRGSTSTTFNYTPPAPINGVLRGVVELGATGFNSFIIRVDERKNWKLEKADYGASLVYEGLATDDDIRKGLKNYIADMLAYGVGAKNIHFVISSGARKVPITEKISRELKSLGYVVNEVSPEREAQLALRSCLPREYANQAFVVDIGSGNTKLSWMEGNRIVGVELPGAKYRQRGISDEAVYREVKDKAMRVPLQLRSTCFIIGGVPYELAKQTRNGKERYTVLKAPEAYTAQGDKQAGGLNIYKAIADATGCRRFIFDWDANFTIGFLLEL